MKHFLVYVQFDPNGREYAYLADDESILPGDQVIVPAGIEHEEKAVIVSRTCYVTETESPYPIKWMKKVIRKISDHSAGDLISKDAPESINTIIDEAFRHGDHADRRTEGDRAVHPEQQCIYQSYSVV